LGGWASLTLPLFEGGKRRAGVRQAQAGYEETVARYRDLVLTAFAEVETQLAAQRMLADGYTQEAAALQAARRQLEIATHRFRSELVPYLQVATAQTAVMERERAVARLRGQQYAAAVALVKALGGGWQGLDQNRQDR
jgi:multidrug efflux system outer membrane protein